MINYPKNYAPLAEEEMEYTSGGLSINWMALGSTVMGLAPRSTLSRKAPSTATSSSIPP